MRVVAARAGAYNTCGVCVQVWLKEVRPHPTRCASSPDLRHAVHHTLPWLHGVVGLAAAGVAVAVAEGFERTRGRE